MITISHETHELIVETIEDSVEYVCMEAFKEGEPLAGQTVWKIVEVLAIAKQVEMSGGFDVPQDEEHF